MLFSKPNGFCRCFSERRMPDSWRVVSISIDVVVCFHGCFGLVRNSIALSTISSAIPISVGCGCSSTDPRLHSLYSWRNLMASSIVIGLFVILVNSASVVWQIAVPVFSIVFCWVDYRPARFTPPMGRSLKTNFSDLATIADRNCNRTGAGLGRRDTGKTTPPKTPNLLL